MTTIESDLLAIARAGLPGAPPPAWSGWDTRLDAVIDCGLAGLFSSCAAAGLVEIDAGMAARLQQQLEIEAIRAVRLEGELLRLAPALARLGAVVLGGPVLAHGAYLDPLFRPCAHLDLLVAGRRMPEAVSLFAHYGYRRAEPSTGSALDSRVGKAFVVEHPGGVEIHLHRTLASGGIVDDTGRSAAVQRDVMIGAHAVPAAPWETHLIECALDVVVAGPAPPLVLRDVAEVAHHPALDLAAAVRLAEAWQVARPVGYGLRVAAERLGLDLPPALATLARRSAEAPPALTAVARVAGPVNGWDDSIAPTYASPAQSLDAPAEGATSPVSPHGSSLAPASVPALPAANGIETSELATVNLPARWAPETVRSADRNGVHHPAGGVVTGRQAAWTNVRPPRQGKNRTRSRPGPSDSTHNGAGDRAGGDSDDPGPPAGQAPDLTPGERAARAGPTRHGLAMGFTGGALLLLTVCLTQLGNDGAGTVLVPAAALFLTGAAKRRITRRYPGQEWVGRWLMLAVAVKLTASYISYLSLVNDWLGPQDATGYNQYGRQFARAWLGRGGTAPELPDLRQHNFIRWFTGIVYYLFGIDTLTAYFVFGLLALIGSYVWFRATVESVPQFDERLYLGLVMFLPSMAYWPSAIGKDSLMQFALGLVALAMARLLRQRLMIAAAIGAPGVWLLWGVRPHLLAITMTAVGCAYIGGRVRAGDHGLRGLVGRPVGLLAVALLAGFTVIQGATFLGIEDLSVEGIEARLDQQTEESSIGGSTFDTGGSSLNPLYLPQKAATVLLRPFPWETTSVLQLFASLEGVALGGLVVLRLSSLGAAVSRVRATPFLLYCLVLVISYAAFFSSIANFGLLVRQRSLVLPALFVLLTVKPASALPASSRRPMGATRVHS